MEPIVNTDIQIQSYKHDETLHRIWEKAKVVEVKDDYVIVINRRTKVIEANGRFWHTREPSVTWFFKEKWFNIIGIIKKNEIHFYCNIASPYMYDDEALKYIDYDLDIKVIDDFSYNVLDRNEYNKHQSKMEYSPKLKKILETELTKLRRMIENREYPFNHKLVEDYYNKYMEDTNNEKG
jgi:protein associated with RNAse G/E